MFSKRLAMIITFTCLQSVNAEIISINGYSLDASTNIVSHTSGLEWLRWSETSRNKDLWQTYLEYTAQGWELASTQQMATLLNDFDFGNTFSNDQDANQIIAINDGAIENPNSPTQSFFKLFGSNVISGYVNDSGYMYEEKGKQESILAMYHSNYTDRYQYLDTAYISEDYYFKISYMENGKPYLNEGYRDGYVRLDGDAGADLFGENNNAFAFVRNSQPINVTAPNTSWALALSLLLMLFSKKLCIQTRAMNSKRFA